MAHQAQLLPQMEEDHPQVKVDKDDMVAIRGEMNSKREDLGLTSKTSNYLVLSLTTRIGTEV